MDEFTKKAITITIAFVVVLVIIAVGYSLLTRAGCYFTSAPFCLSHSHF